MLRPIKPLRNFFTLILISFPATTVHGIHVEKVVVPSIVIAGNSVELQCLYKEEGDELYSLKWWRGEDQFYQYIPPRRSFYSIPGVRVNMTATYSVNEFTPSGLERVVLNTVGLDTAGVFKCEVMADKIFQTVFKEANMSVIVPPADSPIISGYNRTHKTVMKGDRISLTCSVPPAVPPPVVQWKVNNNPVKTYSGRVHIRPHMYVRGLTPVITTLDMVVSEKVLDDAVNGLVVECDTRQPESSYSQKDILILDPERTSYFWLFSKGSIQSPTSTLVYASLLSLVYSMLRW